MAHELTIREDGSAEMFSGSSIVPWHKLGTVVPGLLTAAEAISAAKLDWRVTKEPIALASTEKVVPGYLANVREDSGRVLGVVSQKYRPIQNVQAFDFFDLVVGEKQAIYDTAGSLRGGELVWIMAKLKGTYFIDTRPEDKLERFVLLTNSHQGNKALTMQLVSVRTVCANTLSAALSTATNKVSVRHTGDINAKKMEVARVLKLANAYFDNLQAVMDELAKQEMPKKEAEAFVETLLPITSETGKSSRITGQREQILHLFKKGEGNRGESRWDMLNGVTQFCDRDRTVKVRKNNPDTADGARFASNMWGSGAQLKDRALQLLTTK